MKIGQQKLPNIKPERKNIKINNQSIEDLWKNSKMSEIRVTRVWRRRERNGAGKLLE